ncbi:hypothetical protein LZ31DRAFT_241982 [Colletotrichum somersetense]|nr:hypothetical protein LZ31DRAFT_241982 [Colletotrichum somersetense]
MCRTWTTHAQGHSVIPPSALSLPESPQVVAADPFCFSRFSGRRRSRNLLSAHPTCLEDIVSCAWRPQVGRIPPSVRDQPAGRTLVLSRPRGKERPLQTPCISWIALSISAPLLRTRTVGGYS